MNLPPSFRLGKDVPLWTAIELRSTPTCHWRQNRTSFFREEQHGDEHLYPHPRCRLLGMVSAELGSWNAEVIVGKEPRTLVVCLPSHDVAGVFRNARLGDPICTVNHRSSGPIQYTTRTSTSVELELQPWRLSNAPDPFFC